MLALKAAFPTPHMISVFFTCSGTMATLETNTKTRLSVYNKCSFSIALWFQRGPKILTGNPRKPNEPNKNLIWQSLYGVYEDE